MLSSKSIELREVVTRIEIRVEKIANTCVEKSRYIVIPARTVNRHRWMRRES